jgi:hypothetical protein
LLKLVKIAIADVICGRRRLFRMAAPEIGYRYQFLILKFLNGKAWQNAVRLRRQNLNEYIIISASAALHICVAPGPGSGPASTGSRRSTCRLSALIKSPGSR